MFKRAFTTGEVRGRTHEQAEDDGHADRRHRIRVREAQRDGAVVDEVEHGDAGERLCD